MKKFVSLAVVAIAVLFASQVSAKEWGYITGIPNDMPGESVFRVNIEDVDGKDAGMGPNNAVEPGSHEVKVSLVFNPEWGHGMGMTADKIYYDTITVDAEAKKTYYIGAKVNTSASPEAQADGSFWEAVISKVE